MEERLPLDLEPAGLLQVLALEPQRAVVQLVVRVREQRLSTNIRTAVRAAVASSMIAGEVPLESFLAAVTRWCRCNTRRVL